MSDCAQPCVDKNTYTHTPTHTYIPSFQIQKTACLLVVLFHISKTKISFVLPSFCLFNLFRAIKKDENAVSSSHTKWQRYRFFYLFTKNLRVLICYLNFLLIIIIFNEIIKILICKSYFMISRFPCCS